jgi:hypothetical protein
MTRNGGEGGAENYEHTTLSVKGLTKCLLRHSLLLLSFQESPASQKTVILVVHTGHLCKHKTNYATTLNIDIGYMALTIHIPFILYLHTS